MIGVLGICENQRDWFLYDGMKSAESRPDPRCPICSGELLSVSEQTTELDDVGKATGSRWWVKAQEIISSWLHRPP
jgi:hypothetical protein